MNLTRIKHAATATVAAIAAYASYSHMRELAIEHGQDVIVASLLPVSVDGMLLVATLAMREDRLNGVRRRPWAWIAFAAGVAASIVANVLAAADDITSRVISAWPAVALLLVVEILATGKTRQEPLEPQVEPESTPEPVVMPVVTAAPVRKAIPPAAKAVAKLRAQHPDMPQDTVAKRTGLTVRTVQRHWNVATPAEQTA